MNIWIVALLAVLAGALYKWRIKAAVIIAVLALVFYAVFPFGFWNYKLTLVVETPEGLKTGSVVRRIYVSGEPKILPEQSSFHTSVRGEALVVDLGERGVLFSLIDDGYNIVYKEFPSEPGAFNKIFYYSTLNAKKELAFDKIPMLVRFRDINDPKSVEKVDPNDLEKSLGKGVKLVSATLEMTDEDMTKEVEKYLPWLKALKGGYLDGQFAGGGPELSNILYGGNFKAGAR